MVSRKVLELIGEEFSSGLSIRLPDRQPAQRGDTDTEVNRIQHTAEQRAKGRKEAGKKKPDN